MSENIRAFLKPPVFENDPEKTASARVTNIVVIVLMFVAIFGAIFAFTFGAPSYRAIAGWTSISTLAIYIAFFLLIRRGYVRMVSIVIILIVFITLGGLSILIGGINRPAIYLNIIVLALATLLFTGWQILGITALDIIMIVVIFLLDKNGVLPRPSNPLSTAENLRIFLFSIATIGVLLQVAAINQRNAVQRARKSEREITSANLELLKLNLELEQRVAERTRDVERHAGQLQVAADVGNAAARLRDLNELLQQVTRLIGQRFGFYHVGIFLLDERGEFAVLRAANSEGGQRMLERNHRLKVGQVGIVGYVSKTGEPRIALDVGKDAVFFENPDLPNTHSEMCLPLIIGDNILGALDVQSTLEAAFTEEDITIMKVLADQVSVAIENARLFAETQTSLEITRRAYGDISRAGWERLMRERNTEIGYISLAGSGLSPVSDKIRPESLKAIQTGETVLSNGGARLHLPIKIRGEVIGVVYLEKPQEGSRWSDVDITVADNIAAQLGTALESARLYNEISQRAAREKTLSEIIGRISSKASIDAIMQSTVSELSQLVGRSDIIMQMNPGSKKQ